MTNALRDRYGFLFWLRWILTFAGSFVLSAILWTALLTRLFGAVEGEELLMTWTVAVFGSWFILVIPFMRKKERIWKRLNTDQEKSVDAWLAGVGLFIGLFVLSAFIWSWVLRGRILPNAPGLDGTWAKAVFSSLIVILIPLLVWMYRSADSIFKTANERQTYEPKFRSHWLEPEKRLLPPAVSEAIKKHKQTLPGSHVVTARFKNGEVLSHLFVSNNKEVVGAYDPPKLDLDASQIEEVSVLDPNTLPVYDESKWVRFNIRT
jgi:hypothetical protein